jgi:hypothetical protein
VGVSGCSDFISATPLSSMIRVRDGIREGVRDGITIRD